MADWRLPFSQQESFSQRSRSRSPRRDTWWPPAPRDYDSFDPDIRRMPERWSREEPYHNSYLHTPSVFERFEDPHHYPYSEPFNSWSYERSYRYPFRDGRPDEYDEYYPYDDRAGSDNEGGIYRSFSSRYRRSSRFDDDDDWHRDYYRTYVRPRQRGRVADGELVHVQSKEGVKADNRAGATVTVKPEPERKVEQVGSSPNSSPVYPQPVMTLPKTDQILPVSKFHCDICNVFATSEDQLQGHYRGVKHMKMVNRAGRNTATAEDKGSLENGITIKVCTVCGKHSKEELNNDEHLNSERHKRWIEVSKKRNRKLAKDVSKFFKDVVMSEEEVETVLKLEEQPNGYHCGICDVVMGNYDVYKQHVNGLKHQKVLKQKTDGEDNTKRHHCDVCRVDVQGERSLKAHLDGQKHRKNVSRVTSDTQTVRELPTEKAMPPNSIHCPVCDIYCTSKIDFDNHENGKQHKRKLMERRVKEEQDKLTE